MPPGYHWELGGHYLQQQAAFQSLAVVMVVAVLLIYVMLAFRFRSVVLPLLIFLEQPLSLVSGLFALWVTNTPLNVSSYMGAILLIGLDMKNGILLVEYIQQLLREGMELRPALLLAGRVRFRPILMTSLAAILGLLPLALGIGPGAQMQLPGIWWLPARPPERAAAPAGSTGIDLGRRGGRSGAPRRWSRGLAGQSCDRGPPESIPAARPQISLSSQREAPAGQAQSRRRGGEENAETTSLPLS